ncbi:MAG: cytochrome P450 [Candidatus Dadabacteria bacterium]|nr:MAG: cytochrome P450 [Candidatus Dadabacteria bacterium]
MFAPTVSHRLASCYPAPEVFDLHRYDPDRAEHRTPGAFLPYGVGVHICLGAGIADALIVATLARLLAHYEPLIHPQPDRLRIRARPTPAPVGFRLQLSPRQRTSQAA